jgi:hypothetical protein
MPIKLMGSDDMHHHQIPTEQKVNLIQEMVAWQTVNTRKVKYCNVMLKIKRTGKNTRTCLGNKSSPLNCNA